MEDRICEDCKHLQRCKDDGRLMYAGDGEFKRYYLPAIYRQCPLMFRLSTFELSSAMEKTIYELSVEGKTPNESSGIVDFIDKFVNKYVLDDE